MRPSGYSWQPPSKKKRSRNKQCSSTCLQYNLHRPVVQAIFKHFIDFFHVALHNFLEKAQARGLQLFSGTVKKRLDCAARLTLSYLVPQRFDQRLLVCHFQIGIRRTANSIIGVANHERTILIRIVAYKLLLLCKQW